MITELSVQIRTREEVLNSVKSILIENLNIDKSHLEIDPDTPLFGTGLGLDSVDIVELLISVETEFGVRIADEWLGRRALRTVNTMVDVVLDLREDDER